MAYYYPEGYFGPICDTPVDDVIIERGQRRAIIEENPFVDVYPRPPDGFFDSASNILEPFPPFILTQQCKVDDDGNYYDCEFVYASDPGTPTVNIPNSPWGLDDDFQVPNLTSDSCSPFDPDINIRPLTFFDGNGTAVTKYTRERSSPVTFAVRSSTEFIVSESTVDATFDSNGNIVVTGSGNGVVQLSFEWDDDPNAYGTALGTYSVGGISFTQTPGDETGDDSNSFQVTPQTYTATIVGGTGYGGFTVENNNKTLCFKDLDSNDCNATVKITGVLNTDQITNSGYWSEEGNNYGVWVNPEICTLPHEQQDVTYLVNIPAADTYAFRFGCDDVGKVYLNEETIPILDVEGGIFAGGVLNNPYVVTRSLPAGTLKVIVSVTNSAAGFNDEEGKPFGLAYSWQRNPGGWFLKICRGTGCSEGNSITWIKSGPHQDWSTFMNEYAVYPSNTDPLTDTAHSATYNVNIPIAGDYELELQADNTGTVTFDGTLAASSTSFTSSTTVTLSNLTVGNHLLLASVTNTSQENNTWTNNPGGIAWTLTNVSTSTIVATSLNLNTQGSGNLIWHTRQAIGYEYYEL